MTTKQELHRLIDDLDESNCREALEFLRWLIQDSETLSEEELAEIREGEAEIARGDFVTLDYVSYIGPRGDASHEL